jgi:hypothetical protein
MPSNFVPLENSDTRVIYPDVGKPPSPIVETVNVNVTYSK